MNSADVVTPTRKPRTAMWLLLGMFFAPLLIAFALYYGVPGWRPVGSTHHGDLIDPARPLPQVAFQIDEAGGQSALPDRLFEGKWSTLYIGAGACDDRCQRALTDMRQVRLALNDDLQRVQRVFVPLGECCNREYLDAQHAGLLIARPTQQQTEWLATFPAYEGVAPEQAGRIYIVDPLGNLMMSYPADAPSKGLLEDLKKLLKLSHIG